MPTPAELFAELSSAAIAADQKFCSDAARRLDAAILHGFGIDYGTQASDLKLPNGNTATLRQALTHVVAAVIAARQTDATKDAQDKVIAKVEEMISDGTWKGD